MNARFGNADAAAEILNISRAQLNRIRAASCFVYDPGTGSRRRPTPAESANRRWLAAQHLICPSLCAQKLPGGTWKYDLTRLRRQREDPEWLDAG